MFKNGKGCDSVAASLGITYLCELIEKVLEGLFSSLFPGGRFTGRLQFLIVGPCLVQGKNKNNRLVKSIRHFTFYGHNFLVLLVEDLV